VRGLRSIEVDRSGDPAGSDGTNPVRQAIAVGDRLGSEIAQEIGRCPRPCSDHARPDDSGQLDGEHSDSARRAADQHGIVRSKLDDGQGGG